MVLRPYFALQISHEQEKEYLNIYRQFRHVPLGSLARLALIGPLLFLNSRNSASQRPNVPLLGNGEGVLPQNF